MGSEMCIRDSLYITGVHQGSALSPLLFITVMEEATKECKGTGPWELLYADDLVLTAISKQEAMNLFHNWKNGVEKRGLRVNESKTGHKKEDHRTAKVRKMALWMLWQRSGLKFSFLCML